MRKVLLALLVLIILGIFIGLGFFVFKTFIQKPRSVQSPNVPTKNSQKSNWQEGGVAVEGKYADAEVVDLGEGQFRMYYAVEPEVPGNQLEIFSAKSSDGKNWQKEDGVRHTLSTFPDVMKLSDGKFRMYFQNAGVIKSAISEDGLNFQDEEGTRIDTSNSEGLTLDNVAASTTLLLSDNTYLMVYRGQIDKKYSSEVPNPSTQLLFWATSSDGLDFVKKGIALDSRDTTFQGLSDGPELVNFDGPPAGEAGEIRLYFWSYKGIYYLTYQNGKFSKKPVFDFGTSAAQKSNSPFPENPPGDPTLAKIGGKWFLYFGQHTKGIYYATYKENSKF